MLVNIPCKLCWFGDVGHFMFQIKLVYICHCSMCAVLCFLDDFDHVGVDQNVKVG